MNLNDLQVRPGDAIVPAWNRLLKWAKQFTLHSGANVRLNRTPNGTTVVADLRSNQWVPRFRVRVSDMSVVVGEGTVNNLVPRINGVGLDGLDSAGKEFPAPGLKITSGPNEDFRSWVCVQVKVDIASGRMNPDDKESLTIIHTSTLDPRSADGGFPDNGEGIGLQPLAMLVWAEGVSVKRVFQITHHNLQHRFVRSGTGRGTAGRHFFWAV